MFRKSALLLTALLLSTPSFAQKAAKPVKECPFSYSEREKIIDTLKKATCADSLATFEACAAASSGDIELGDAVTERCEADFAAKLTPMQKKSYNAEHKRCDTKYAKKDGTMYRAFEAFCHAETAKKWSVRLSKPAR